MAKPTPEQVIALEKAHKKQLADLLQAIRFRFIIYKKLGDKHPEYTKYANFIWKMWQNWYNRQLKYEKSGGAKKEGILKNDWLTPEGKKKLQALVDSWNKENATAGMGFIPLIIWAVTAIVGFFTAEEIVDELNTTTEEQAELVKTSDDICTKYGFSKEECKAFITQQNTSVKEANSGGFPTGKLLFIGGAVLLYMNRDKIFKPKTAS